MAEERRTAHFLMESTMPHEAASHETVPLTCFRQGQNIRIAWVGLEDAEAERLRDLGVREGCKACVMMNADKCILGLGACRLALRREVAMQLFATPAP